MSRREGRTGAAVLREVERERHAAGGGAEGVDGDVAALPVVALTADVEFRSKYAEVGFDGILLKPVTLETLVQVLAEILPPR